MKARNDDKQVRATGRRNDKMRWGLALLLAALMALSMAGCGVEYGADRETTMVVTPTATPETAASPAIIADGEEAPEGEAAVSPLIDSSPAVADNTPDGRYYSVDQASTLPSTGNKTALSTVDIYKVCSPSVVAISTTGTQDSYFGQISVESAGSGVIISEDGYILTCNHVIESMDKVMVTLENGEEYEAQVMGGDSSTDLAVLKIDAKGLTTVTLGDSDALQVGELAVAIGNTLGVFANSQTTGTISGKDRALRVQDNDGSNVQMMNLLQHDVAISPGNSGGGLFNSYGELVGITSAKSSGEAVEGVGFAIPINDAKAIINDLVNYGYVVRPQIGITGFTISEETSKQFNIPVGVYVTEVTEGGAADKAGIVKGDVITKVDGEAIAGIEELTALKNSKKVGDKLELTIVHANEETKVTITLEQEAKAAATPAPEPTAEYRAEVPENLPPALEDFFR